MIVWMAVAAAAAGGESDENFRRFQVSLQGGALHDGSDAYDVFADRDRLPTWGGRFGVRVHDRVELVAGLAHAGRGAQVALPDAPGADFAPQNNELLAALSTNALTLGPRVDLGLLDERVLPYVQTQLLTMHGMARLDDDGRRNDNLGQVRGAGVGAGLLGVAGVELRLPVGSVSLSLHGELGYGAVSPIRLGDLGAIAPHGLAGNGGLGIHF